MKTIGSDACIFSSSPLTWGRINNTDQAINHHSHKIIYKRNDVFVHNHDQDKSRIDLVIGAKKIRETHSTVEILNLTEQYAFITASISPQRDCIKV